MGISADTGFIGILIGVLLCHGKELDQQRRAKREKRAAEQAAKKEAERRSWSRERQAERHAEIDRTVFPRRKRPSTIYEPEWVYPTDAEQRR